MLMILSFAYRDLREQQLLSSPSIAQYILDYALKVSKQSPHITTTAIVGTSNLPFLPPAYSQGHLSIKERMLAEMDWANTMVHEDTKTKYENEWAVVFRPAQGGISLTRLNQFCSAVQSIKIKKHTWAVATLLKKHSTLTHPYWGLRSAPRIFANGESIHIPIDDATMRDDLKHTHPQLCAQHGTNDINRSQDVPLLLHSDEALYAFQLGNKRNESIEEYTHHTIPCQGLVQEHLPLFYQLPTFDLNKNQAIDVASLERLVEKNSQGEFALKTQKKTQITFPQKT